MTENRYQLRIARAAAHALAEVLPEKVAAAAHEFVTGPLLGPPPGWQPPRPPLTPLWSARRGPYRVIYLVDDANRVVEVTAIRHRRDAYHI
ncbi:type II toxin-antitoxin system RelE/ParE family toxin [Frankia sp. Cj5]|uniref:type II toxin-antitoxin system RelE family toxin n=1 Tax=Frankia sp. Cj5 TaxID=2880978 RepID=UPI001EF52F24|nr:type II toxin-antitoxin system RelE/ParE family toxin [Frankia sp. Cj5]